MPVPATPYDTGELAPSDAAQEILLHLSKDGYLDEDG